MKKQVWEGDYLSLFNDGTIGVNDGVGYIDTMEIEDTRDLYNALFILFNKKVGDNLKLGDSTEV